MKRCPNEQTILLKHVYENPPHCSLQNNKINKTENSNLSDTIYFMPDAAPQ